eukprot:gene42144-biopygen7134
MMDWLRNNPTATFYAKGPTDADAIWGTHDDIIPIMAKRTKEKRPIAMFTVMREDRNYYQFRHTTTYLREAAGLPPAEPWATDSESLWVTTGEDVIDGTSGLVLSIVVGMGPFPKSRSGNLHIAAIVDHFTKWTIAVPISSKEALHGRECRTPLDNAIPTVPRFTIPNSQDYADDLVYGITAARNSAQTQLGIAHSLYNKPKVVHTLLREIPVLSGVRSRLMRRVRRFEVGDQVLMWVPVIRKSNATKLTKMWRGPFTVTDKIGLLTYKSFGRSVKRSITGRTSEAEDTTGKTSLSDTQGVELGDITRALVLGQCQMTAGKRRRDSPSDEVTLGDSDRDAEQMDLIGLGHAGERAESQNRRKEEALGPTRQRVEGERQTLDTGIGTEAKSIMPLEEADITSTVTTTSQGETAEPTVTMLAWKALLSRPKPAEQQMDMTEETQQSEKSRKRKGRNERNKLEILPAGTIMGDGSTLTTNMSTFHAYALSKANRAKVRRQEVRQTDPSM